MLEELKIGFIPLTDSAPLIVAKEEGFFAKEGLRVQLCKEASWSTIRDKLVFGEYDAAHLLAPMLLASSLGVNSIKQPLVTAYSFGLNGNAVSVSNSLYHEMAELDPVFVEQPKLSAQVLKQVVDSRLVSGQDKLRFAVVFPFSMHYYLMNQWFKSAGLRVNEDIEILVVPPSHVVQALESGMIDGYCVGEPWNTHAVKKQVGVTVITGYEIWNNAPEKVLGVRQSWAEEHSELHSKLIWALYQASAWMDQDANRARLIEYLSLPEYVNAPRSSIENALQGQVCNPVSDTCRSIPNFALPYKYFANFPWQSHAEWMLKQMQELGQVVEPIDIERVASECYLSDCYREVLQAHGVQVPDINTKPEGEHSEPWLYHGYLLAEDEYI